jgi:hypothetical protein
MDEKWTALDDALMYASSTSQQPKDGNDLARAELSALRDLLAAVRETKHLGNHAKPGHIAAALELCEEQLKAVERIEQ